VKITVAAAAAQQPPLGAALPRVGGPAGAAAAPPHRLERARSGDLVLHAAPPLRRAALATLLTAAERAKLRARGVRVGAAA
jgi:hypothetical protein